MKVPVRHKSSQNVLQGAVYDVPRMTHKIKNCKSCGLQFIVGYACQFFVQENRAKETVCFERDSSFTEFIIMLTQRVCEDICSYVGEIVMVMIKWTKETKQIVKTIY